MAYLCGLWGFKKPDIYSDFISMSGYNKGSNQQKGSGYTALISIAEYAKRHGKSPTTIRRYPERFQTIQKVGRNWIIDEDEPYPDNNAIKHGKYVGWFAKYRKDKNKKAP